MKRSGFTLKPGEHRILLGPCASRPWTDFVYVLFVGHSTGDLDVRMLLAPNVKIASGDSEERIAHLMRTVISVATPHHGTPPANHFATMQGQTLLRKLHFDRRDPAWEHLGEI